MNMEKPNYKEYIVNFNGKAVKVTNWWNWYGVGSADLYLDDEHLDQNRDLIANPKKALLSKYDVSDDVESVEVYASYVFKLKLLIVVNGNIIYQDKLSLIDRFVHLFFVK